MTTRQTTLDAAKSDLIDKAISLAQAWQGHRRAAPRPGSRAAPAYYRHVAPEDVLDRSDVDLYGAFAPPLQARHQPPPGHRAGAGVHAHGLAEHGWSANAH